MEFLELLYDKLSIDIYSFYPKWLSLLGFVAPKQALRHAEQGLEKIENFLKKFLSIAACSFFLVSPDFSLNAPVWFYSLEKSLARGMFDIVLSVGFPIEF